MQFKFKFNFYLKINHSPHNTMSDTALPEDAPVRLDCDPEEIRARAEAMLAKKQQSYQELVDHEAIEDFNERARRVHEQVRGIMDGSIDFEELDR